MSWLFLSVAIVFEITVALAAGLAQGFTRVGWTVVTLISGGIATYFLSLALLTFDVGVGYALWTSIAGVRIVVLSWSVVAVVFFLLTLFCLSRALRGIDVGIGYAVWAGIGAVGAAVLGPVFFDEVLTPSRAVWLAVIISGVVWLKVADGHKG